MKSTHSFYLHTHKLALYNYISMDLEIENSCFVIIMAKVCLYLDLFQSSKIPPHPLTRQRNTITKKAIMELIMTQYSTTV